MSNDIPKAWEDAMLDAVTLGIGVLIIRSDMTISRVSPEEYHILADELNFAQGNSILMESKK